MGHRGLIGFVIDGQEKLTYSHWGSYPEGNGLTMLEFARGLVVPEGRFGRPSIDQAQLQRIRDLAVVEEDSKPTAKQRELLARYTDLSVGDQTDESWYVLLRETQGDPERILDAGYMIDSTPFAADSLFNEGSYLIDLDAGTYEAYDGFVKEPHNEGRFAHLTPRPDHEGNVEYYPIKLAGSWPLLELPTNQEFLAHLAD